MDPLQEWLEGMHPRVTGLVDHELAQGALPDYSAASLARLEAEVLARSARNTRSAPTAEFLERVAAFLGEALLTLAGGHWEWDDQGDGPVVAPDAALGLAPLSPARIVGRAQESGDGGEFGRAYRSLEAAIAERRAAVPGWEPVKELTPGLDRDLTLYGEDFLAHWLPERAAQHHAWLATYTRRPERWDFSPDSLGELEETLRELVACSEELASHPEFTDGAVWYLGEVIRPAMRARWNYYPGDPAENMFLGRPFLDQFLPDGRTAVPFLILQIALNDRAPGMLRRIHDRLA
ncbi:hypothetical protein [Streptomyces sp. NRRL WC-3742]|uniref:hypothetical protein n=1 Tax=Streptomyces sp. NRRL WC-3742 TaxID=1463934 RepID=UPI0004C79613|nr:hypothetical protein [Streptomyces sp. NRRL WC-3742]